MLLCGAAPSMGCFCGAGRGGARALAAHRCNCKRARLCRCVGVAAGCVDGHACFRARLANRSMARTAAGFVCEERVQGAVERCEGREEVCVGCASALVAVYASNFCRPIAKSSKYCVSSRLGCIGSCCRIAASRNPQRTAAKPKVSGSSSEEPAKHRIPSAARRQRYATRHDPKPCSRQPCAAPPRKAAAC